MQKQDPTPGDPNPSDPNMYAQNSALSWSRRQQLRRTSAAMRHAAASRQVPHQDNRLPPGEAAAQLPQRAVRWAVICWPAVLS